MTISQRRSQQATFAQAAAANRFAGSGGGSGMSNSFMRQLAVSGAVGSQNFSSTSFADVTGTSVSFHMTLFGNVELRAFLTGKVTAGANNGLWQIAITGPNSYSGSSGSVYVGVTSFITLFAYLRLYGLQPGVYTAKLQAAVDVAGTTFNAPGNSTVLEAVLLGQG